MLCRITLHLARDHAFPEGSSERGYEIVAPLDGSGHLDAEAWRKLRGLCHVRRFWTDEDDRTGLLVHEAGGTGGATWEIEYADAGEEEPGYRLGEHRFIVGEYVSIQGGSQSHTFKVAAIDPA